MSRLDWLVLLLGSALALAVTGWAVYLALTGGAYS
jgi:hypothetical protein